MVANSPVAELVHAAAAGDQDAWGALVERYASLVWNVARAHRLDAADASDVSQTVWLRLVEHLGRLRQPEALAGWLATTTKHECLRTIRRAGREIPDDELETSDDRLGSEPGPESELLRAERRAMVWAALDKLSVRCRTLLRALSSSPDSSYVEIAGALDMPVGSIGPTRSRCLQHLRRQLEAAGDFTPDD
jgi:RNA polymerase sigma factor (sigma-70 family)